MAATVTMLANLHHASMHNDMHSTLRITGEHKPTKMEALDIDSDTLENDRIDYNDVFMVSESLAAAAAAATTTSSSTALTSSVVHTEPTTMTTTASAHLHQQPKTGGVKRSRSSSSSGGTTPELLRCKRRINFAQLGYGLPPAAPTSVARRNERERNRVKLVNLGFATLREHVPNGAKNKKMSKVETLKSAVDYIRKLQELLIMDGATGADIENALLAFGSSFDDNSTMDSPGSSSEVGSSSQTENIAPSHHHGHLHHHHHLSQHQLGHHEDPVTSPESAPSPHTVHHHIVLQQQQQPPPPPHQRYPSAIRNVHSTSSTTTTVTSGGHVVSSHPPSSVSPVCSVASSPTPSYTSDYSSYEPLSPEDEDLLDFTSWFS